MTLFAGFIGTYYLQKNNYNSVFRDTKKFTAQFKYQINSKQNSINPHYWLDFVPLYSSIKFKDEKVNSYNLTFGNVNQYQQQISQLSREYPHQKELRQLLPFFDLSSSFNNINDAKCAAFINQITSVYKSNNK